MKHYVATVERGEKMWLIYVGDDVDRWTQARNLGEVEVMARDLIAVMTDRPAGVEEVDLTVDLKLGDRTEKLLRQYHEATEAAQVAKREAARKHHAVAKAMADQGLTYRDIGVALGVSFQRAEQLVKAVA